MSEQAPLTSPANTFFQSRLEQVRERHNSFLNQTLDNLITRSQSLDDAMRYALLLGGKRVRPFLVYAVGELLGASPDDLDAPAAAIECIHAYSLTHDDLPAMDDDNLRRGQPTCHRAFNEATAILAGDALQSLAFELLASHPFTHVTPEKQLQLVQLFAKAGGQAGMCGGQALDLAATGSHVNLAELEQIHRFKTGALIEAAVMAGIICSPLSSAEDQARLQEWAKLIGLAFQVQDDILDVVGDTTTLGKQQGSDIGQAKSTYPALMGLPEAQAYLHDLHQKALHALAAIPYNTLLLEAFTNYLTTRDR